MTNTRTWFAVAVVTGALAVLLGLGSWQLLRRAEKHALIAHIEAQMKAPPVGFPAVIADARGFDYRRVTVSGRYLHEHEMRLLNRVRKGTAGVHLITPLAPDAGPVVLVDRGWAPRNIAGAESGVVDRPSGRVTVSGIARLPAAPGYFVPANEPARGQWFSLDPARMAAARGLGPVAPVVVVADVVVADVVVADVAPGGRASYPIGAEVRIEIRDDHLQYALTWYSLALGLVAVAVIALRRKSGSEP